MSARRELGALWSRCLALRERVAQPEGLVDAGTRRRLDACIDELASATRRLGNAGMLSPDQAGALERAVSDLAAARGHRRPLAEAVAHAADTLRTVAGGLHVALSDARPGPATPLAGRPHELVGVAVDPWPGGAACDPAAGRSRPPAAPAVAAPEPAPDGAGRGGPASRHGTGGPPAGVAPDPACPPADEAVARSASEAVQALDFVTTAAARGGHRLGEFSRAHTDDGYQLSAHCRGCGDEVRLGRGPDEWWFAPIAPCPRASADAAVPTGIP